MIDYTALVNRLLPAPGGEDVARLRTGVVSAVNSDGTVDIAVSGVVVPSVPVVSGGYVSSGSPAQILVSRGSLLVLGNVRTFVSSPSVTTVTSTSTVTINSTSYVASGTGLVFVANSTEVTVSITDLLRIDPSSDATRSVSASTEVRTGGTIGSGSLIAGANDSNRASVITDNGEEIRITAGWNRPVSGLTPGNTYNVQIFHSVNNTAVDLANSAQRSLSVFQ